MSLSDQLSLSLQSKRKSRAEQIFQAFVKFHLANPDIWKHFRFYADKARESGRQNYSANAIFERIRWYVDIETKSSGELKLNNNFRAYYARMYHVAVPEAAGFFRNRERTSEHKSAQENDIQEFIGGSPGDEADLLLKLKALL